MGENNRANDVQKCNILGVNIAVVTMSTTIKYIVENISNLRGSYICVSNVHTTVMSHENAHYKMIQNQSALSLPDGKPLSIVCKLRGYKDVERVTGPDLMEQILKISASNGYRHYFYGSTNETLSKLKQYIEHKYGKNIIAGMYSPPFRKLTEEEDQEVINKINESKADFIWVGLGAPKQENWMFEKKGKIMGLMVGVGAGFDYFAGNIKRAPKIMQDLSLEWLYRLIQDPKRLWKRYLTTNFKFISLLIWTSLGFSKNTYKDTSSTKNKKKNILVAHNFYQIAGGEDTVVKNEVDLLRKKGHNVFLYTRDNKEIKTFSFFSKVCLPFASLFSIKTYKEVFEIIKKENIEVLHVHNTLTLISPSIYYAAFKAKIPIVQTVHNFRLLCPAGTLIRDNSICEKCLKGGLYNSIRYKCYRNSYIQTLISAATIKLHRVLGTYKKINYICLTEFNKELLSRLNKNGRNVININKVFVKPNFATSEHSMVPYNERKNQMVFVGRLDRLKGIQVLVEAWKDISDITLLICGTGPEEDFVKKSIQKFGTNNIVFMGFVPHEKVTELIANSMALIVPSQWYEGLPMTIVEAYACGTVVIGSDIGNVKNIVELAKSNRIFNYESVFDLKTKVLEISENSPDETEIKSIYDKYFCSEVNYQMLEDIYRQI